MRDLIEDKVHDGVGGSVSSVDVKNVFPWKGEARRNPATVFCF